MKVKVVNSSSKRTREKIKKAFALLVKEHQSLDKLTVTDLVREAEITRGAFYTHYDNIYEVAKDIQDETFEILQNNISALNSPDNINLYFDQIINYLKENEDIYAMILASDDPIRFTNRLNRMMNHLLYETLANKNINNLELNISFFIDGCINLVIKHFRREIEYSLDEINIYMKEMFKRLFSNN